jgi:CysZ protein
MGTPILALFVERYYYGFSMLDYSCETQIFPQQSIEYVEKHRGLAIGNGLVFYALHGILVVGWIFAPAHAVVAATISLYHQRDSL